MDNLAMTYRAYVNDIKMQKCSEKHPVSRANNVHAKKW